ncbi:hypothetical protein P7C70_g1316, partial [Phenoliferia sp. Uapishka_3]
MLSARAPPNQGLGPGQALPPGQQNRSQRASSRPAPKSSFAKSGSRMMAASDLYPSPPAPPQPQPSYPALPELISLPSQNPNPSISTLPSPPYAGSSPISEAQHWVLILQHRVASPEFLLVTKQVPSNTLRFATPTQRSSLLGSSASQRANTCASQSASGGLDSYHADLFLIAAEAAFQVLSAERWREGGLKKPLLAVTSDHKGALGKLRKGTGNRVDEFEALMLRGVAERVRNANGAEVRENLNELENGVEAGNSQKVILHWPFPASVGGAFSLEGVSGS